MLKTTYSQQRHDQGNDQNNDQNSNQHNVQQGSHHPHHSQGGDQVWLVQQHQHAQVSGYLAAYWGGANGFARPGHYAGATDAARWRDEVILGIAEHDNGWWEWEAMPRISGRDHLPVGLGEAAEPSPANEFDAWRTGGFERWHVGIDRVAWPHPYGALLISEHAYWLYAVAFDDLLGSDGEALRHPVFGDPKTAGNLASDRVGTRAFLEDLQKTQAVLKQRLADDPVMAAAIRPEHLLPHVRLVQLLDTLSLFMARHDQDEHVLRDVPRAGWDDRVDMTWRRTGEQTFMLDPYPFEIDRLTVHMPVKIASTGHDETTPALTRLHRLRPDVLRFELHGA